MKIDSDKLIQLVNSFIEIDTKNLKDEEANGLSLMYSEGLYKGKIIAFEQLVDILKSSSIESLK